MSTFVVIDKCICRHTGAVCFFVIFHRSNNGIIPAKKKNRVECLDGFHPNVIVDSVHIYVVSSTLGDIEGACCYDYMRYACVHFKYAPQLYLCIFFFLSFGHLIRLSTHNKQIDGYVLYSKFGAHMIFEL